MLTVNNATTVHNGWIIFAGTVRIVLIELCDCQHVVIFTQFLQQLNGIRPLTADEVVSGQLLAVHLIRSEIINDLKRLFNDLAKSNTK